MTGRVLGIDPGKRRVGLAVSDPLGITAQGLDTFDRRTGDVIAHLREIVSQWKVNSVVMGHPVSMSGRPNAASLEAEAMAGLIRRKLSLPVVLWDERLTSVEAGRVLAGEKAKRGAVDRVAAVLILQSYLDSRATS